MGIRAWILAGLSGYFVRNEGWQLWRSRWFVLEAKAGLRFPLLWLDLFFPDLDASPRGLEARGAAMGYQLLEYTVADMVRSIGYMRDMGGLG